MKTIFLLILLISLSSCTTFSIPVTESKAKSYSTVEEFIVGAFAGIDRLLFGDKDVMKINGVIWKAHVTTLNQMYLYKPKKDLVTYCKANGGRINHLSSSDLITLKEISTGVRDHIKFVTLFGDNITDIKAANDWYQKTAKNKSHKNNVFATEAISDGRIGVYTCVNDGTLTWISSIALIDIERSLSIQGQLIIDLRISGKSL